MQITIVLQWYYNGWFVNRCFHNCISNLDSIKLWCNEYPFQYQTISRLFYISIIALNDTGNAEELLKIWKNTRNFQAWCCYRYVSTRYIVVYVYGMPIQRYHIDFFLVQEFHIFCPMHFQCTRFFIYYVDLQTICYPYSCKTRACVLRVSWIF